jgi:hypothetical protein
MMSLRDELEPVRTNGGTCSVDEFVKHHDPKTCVSAGCDGTTDDWVELLGEPPQVLQHSRMHRLMKKHGYTKTDQAVSHHRKGDCACGRSA